MGGSAPSSRMGTVSPAHALRDRDMMRSSPAPSLPADAGAWQDVASAFVAPVPSCHAAPSAAGKTLGLTGCQVCSCPVATAHGEGR